MKKIVCLVVLLAVLMVGSLVACNNNTEKGKHFEATPSTCLKEGNTEYWMLDGKYYSDKDCTEEITKDKTIVKKTGHTFGAWIDQLAPTCAKKGEVAHKDCSVCGKHFDEFEIEIAEKNYYINNVAHTWDDGEVVTPANGLVDGEKKYTCTVCQKTKTEPYSSKEVTFFNEEYGTFDGTANIAIVKVSDLSNDLKSGVGEGFTSTGVDAFVLKATPIDTYNTMYVKLKDACDLYNDLSGVLKITARVYFDYTSNSTLYVKFDNTVLSAQEGNRYFGYNAESIKGQWADLEFTVENGLINPDEELQYLVFSFGEDLGAELYIADIKIEYIVDLTTNLITPCWKPLVGDDINYDTENQRVYGKTAEDNPIVFNDALIEKAKEEGYNYIYMTVAGQSAAPYVVAKTNGGATKLFSVGLVHAGPDYTSKVAIKLSDLSNTDGYYLGLSNLTDDKYVYITDCHFEKFDLSKVDLSGNLANSDKAELWQGSMAYYPGLTRLDTIGATANQDKIILRNEVIEKAKAEGFDKLVFTVNTFSTSGDDFTLYLNGSAEGQTKAINRTEKLIKVVLDDLTTTGEGGYYVAIANNIDGRMIIGNCYFEKIVLAQIDITKELTSSDFSPQIWSINDGDINFNKAHNNIVATTTSANPLVLSNDVIEKAKEEGYNYIYMTVCGQSAAPYVVAKTNGGATKLFSVGLVHAGPDYTSKVAIKLSDLSNTDGYYLGLSNLNDNYNVYITDCHFEKFNLDSVDLSGNLANSDKAELWQGSMAYYPGLTRLDTVGATANQDKIVLRNEVIEKAKAEGFDKLVLSGIWMPSGGVFTMYKNGSSVGETINATGNITVELDDLTTGEGGYYVAIANNVDGRIVITDCHFE